MDTPLSARITALLLLALSPLAEASVFTGNPSIIEISGVPGPLPPTVVGVDQCDGLPPLVLPVVPGPGGDAGEVVVKAPACAVWSVPVVGGVPDWTGAVELDLLEGGVQFAGLGRVAAVRTSP